MRYKEQLEASLTDEGRYRLLIDAVTDYAIYMLDPAGLVTSWNSGARRFKGYEEAEILGQHFSVFYTEEDRLSGLPQRALDTAANEGRFECEGWRVRKDGTRFWSHVLIDPILSTSGTLLGYAKVTRDLTERKIAEESLKHSESQFSLLVQSVTDYAIYMLSPTGHITNWNQGAQRIKGYRADEIIGKHFSQFFTEEDRQRGDPQRSLKIAAAEGRYEKQGWRVRKDGSQFWANVVIDPIRSETGTILGFAKITRDITDSMEAQRALDQAREALFQAQKMESLGQLTGGIAHDFNNLLTIILGSLEIVRKRVPEDPKISRLLDNAIQGAQRGASLTQRMLAFARRQELKPEPLDALTLVRGMTELLQRSLGPQIRIETRFPLSLAPVMADANQLELAVLNLAMNARDAMPEGGLITIVAREEQLAAQQGSGELSGRYICLSVVDTGEGMDEATLSRAMEPFFTTKGVGKGTGLGLSMVHGLAEQLSGRLILKSQVNAGTTAELWLPVAQSPVMVSTEQPNAVQPIMGKPPTVLVVDDDRLLLVSTCAMLDDLGYKSYEAASGARALEILRATSGIDLVITDQIMPHMTGAQLATKIHAQWPDLPVVLATGYAEQLKGVVAELPRLAKPFNQMALLQVIHDVMR